MLGHALTHSQRPPGCDSRPYVHYTCLSFSCPASPSSMMEVLALETKSMFWGEEPGLTEWLQVVGTMQESSIHRDTVARGPDRVAELPVEMPQ